MSQDEINDAEWRNPENWTSSKVGFYFSKRDTRVWVPKRIPALGWTLNLAHRAGAMWLLALLIVPTLSVVAALAYICLRL